MKNAFYLFMTIFFLLLHLLLYMVEDSFGDTMRRNITAKDLKKVLSIKIDGMINPSTVDYIDTALKKIKETKSDALLIFLDTPGGLLTSTKEVVKSILNSEVPVIVYVYPKGATATSAGVFITLSAHIAAMSPGTSIGAAHPVTIGDSPSFPIKKEGNKRQKEPSRDIMAKKVENFAISFIKSIAQERGRNAEWAVEAVRKSSSITASEALEKGVVDIIAPDVDDLFDKINRREVKIKEKTVVLVAKKPQVVFLPMNLKQKIVDILSTPDIAFLLLSLGSLGLLIEFYNPGLVFPGVAGLISLLLGFVSLQILPFNYVGLALIFFGIMLFIAEIYVTSYGLLTLGGLISFTLGAVFLFNTPEVGVGVGYGVIGAAVVPIMLFSLFVAYSLAKSFKIPVRVGFEELIGKEAEVISWEGRLGKVFIHGEYWNAYSDEELKPGERVRIVEGKAEDGLRLKVKKNMKSCFGGEK